MKKMLRRRAFDEYEPTLSDAEITLAHDRARMVVSFKGKPHLRARAEDEDITYLAVKLALYDGSFTTVLLDRVVAEALASFIRTAANIDWKTSEMQPAARRH